MQNLPRSTDAPAASVSSPAETARGLTPPRRVWVTILSLAAAVGLVRGGWLEPIVGSVVDQAVRNIITLILCFAGLVSVMVWLVRESGHTRAVKRAVVGGLLGAVGLAALAVRIERVSGDLVPEFAWRWRPSRDRLLPAATTAPPPAADAGISWPAVSAGDFPRFLGPAGDGVLESPVLDADWAARPPRQVWREPIGAGWSGFATCGDHAVTLEQRGDEELVSCRRVSDGRLDWTVSVPGRHQTVLGGAGPRSTPTIHDGVVFAHGATGWLHAIDGATGRVVWRKNLVDELGIDPVAHAAAVAWGRAGSPLVLGDLVILPAGGPRTRREADATGYASLVAFDRGT
ncbi:MAG: PQQ-binding-like beta-propeller repeat protein, partial [Planctomycetia bacterium]